MSNIYKHFYQMTKISVWVSRYLCYSCLFSAIVLLLLLFFFSSILFVRACLSPSFDENQRFYISTLTFLCVCIIFVHLLSLISFTFIWFDVYGAHLFVYCLKSVHILHTFYMFYILLIISCCAAHILYMPYTWYFRYYSFNAISFFRFSIDAQVSAGAHSFRRSNGRMKRMNECWVEMTSTGIL